MFYSLQAIAGLLPVFLVWLLLIGGGLMLERIRPVCGLPSRAASSTCVRFALPRAAAKTSPTIW